MELSLNSNRFVITLGLALFFIFPIPFDNLKFVGLSILLFVLAIKNKDYSQSFVKEYPKYSLSFLLFIVVALSCVFSAINSSLLIYHLICWLLIICSFIVFSIKDISKSFKNSITQSVSIVYVFYLVWLIGLYALGYRSTSLEFQSLSFQNNNMTACLLLVLWYFNLLFPSIYLNKITLVYYIMSLLVFCILIESSARGTILIFVGLFVMRLRLSFRWILGIFALVAIAAILLFLSGENIALIDEFTKQGEGLRLELISKTFASLSWSNLLLGEGLGNWHNVIYGNSFSSFSDYRFSANFLNMDNHNLFSTLLLEVGVLGLGGLFFPFLFVFFKTVKHSNFSRLFGVYLVLSLVYRGVNFDTFYFSEIEFFSFISLGLAFNSNN